MQDYKEFVGSESPKPGVAMHPTLGQTEEFGWQHPGALVLTELTIASAGWWGETQFNLHFGNSASAIKGVGTSLYKAKNRSFARVIAT